MAQDFVGAGWSFPLGVDSTGGIALARGDQELVQAMQLIRSLMSPLTHQQRNRVACLIPPSQVDGSVP